jgi:cellulose synthase/poly-beta-1,6-N-acetylglucosamine synthase-like glycosyltransferase
VPTVVLVGLGVIVGAYILQVSAAALGFLRVQRQPRPPAPDVWPSVSIVVPARNEADGIAQCLDSLRACNYPEDRYEIIIVDDGSRDGTAARVQARPPVAAGAARESPQVELVERSTQEASPAGHKPAAVAEGIEAASGDVILTTDADCTVEPGWIRSMVRRCTPDTPFVAGPVAYEHNERVLSRLQALELSGLVAYGAGTLGLGLPTFCNSANVAFRRNIIDAGPDMPDGAAQDELFLQHVAYDTDRTVTFNPDPEALVTTTPVASIGAYLRQQARWAHMGLRYPYQRPRALVVGLWLAHVVLLAACATAVGLASWRQPVLVALLGKMGADALLTAPAAAHFGQRGLLRSTVPTELFLLVTVPLIGILGSFGSLEWKGRPLQ